MSDRVANNTTASTESSHSNSIELENANLEEGIVMGTPTIQEVKESNIPDNLSIGFNNHPGYSETSSSDGGMGDTSSSAVDQDLLDQQPLNFCEKIPLYIKLLLIGMVSLTGITVIGIWLCVYAGINLHASLSKGSMLYVIEETETLNSFIEQEMLDSFSHLIVSRNNSRLRLRWAQTDRAFERYSDVVSRAARTFGSYSAREAVDRVDRHLEQLEEVRDQVMNNDIDPQDMTHYYSQCYIVIMDVGMHMVTAADMQQSVLQQNLLSRIKSRDFALMVVISSMAFTRSNFTDETLERFVVNVQDRNTNIHLFKGLGARWIVEKYEETVERSPEYPYLTRIERLIFNNLDADRFNFNADQYYGNATARLENISSILDEANSVIVQESQTLISRGIIEIVAVILVGIVFFIITVLVSLVMSRTIVGPWRRMLKLQELTIQRFVPAQFLGLIDCNKVGDVTRGKSKARNLTIMCVSISNFCEISQFRQGQEEKTYAREQGNAKVIHFVNQYLEYVSEIVRNHNGYIEHYDRDVVFACFKSPTSATSCATHYQKAVTTFNNIHRSEYPAINVTIGIHHIENLLIAAVGEHDRIHASFLSEELDIAKKLNDLAYRYHVKIMASSGTYNRIQKSLRKTLKNRLICKLLNHQNEILDCLELMSTDSKESELKRKSAHLFSQAMECLYHANYLDALINFESAGKICKDGDPAIPYFIKKCQTLLADTRSNMANISLVETLRDSSLFKAFNEFCKAEHSEENIELWKLIQEFKNSADRISRDGIAVKIRTQYLNPQSTNCVNLSEGVKKKTIDHYQDISTNGMCSSCATPCTIMNNSIFDQIQNSIELVMSDTFQRFSKTDAFQKAYQSSSLIIPPTKFYHQILKKRI